MKDMNIDFKEPIYSEEQKRVISALTPEQVQHIDQVLLANIVTTYRKINRIVGGAMTDGRLGVPDLYYAHRVYLMAESGKVEIRGRFVFGWCEVRLLR